MYGAYHITVLGKEKKSPAHKYDVTGSLCENNKVCNDRMLPVEIGDIWQFTMQAHTDMRWASTTSGKLRSAELC